jgi:hypothetical protein
VGFHVWLSWVIAVQMEIPLQEFQPLMQQPHEHDGEMTMK